jgi:hypothetical protein
VRKMAEELLIEKKEYGFRLVLTTTKESYFIKDHKNGWFTMTIEEDRQAIDIIDDKYENLGVRDLQELLCKIMTDPSETLEMLLGEKKDIEKVTIEFF